MIICNLTKPETTFDHVRKVYKDLIPTDVALLATALVESGKFAIAERDDAEFRWPEDHEKLTLALSETIRYTESQLVDTTKKATKATEEMEVVIDLHLRPNLEAGEKLLGDREDLKTLLADILDAGVEFQYAPNDIGWPWSMERVNFATVTEGGTHRRSYRVRPVFTGSIMGTEVGGPAKKRARAKS